MRTSIFLFGICTGIFAALDPLRADDTNVAKESFSQLRGSYYVNREIHVGVYGQPEGAPLTKGHWDFKPSSSKDESAIVYHAGGELFVYGPGDGSTQKVSTNDKADDRYPHMEKAPK